MAQILIVPEKHAAYELLKQHIQNPGRLYNDGNVIALASAVLFCTLSATAENEATFSALKSFFFGTWPAVFTTIAVLIFFLGGKKYSDAWSRGFPPNQKLNSQGHALSAIGATLIGVGLIGLSQNVLGLILAVITTLLHAGGKLASWFETSYEKIFKTLPLLSRATYLASLLLDIAAICFKEPVGHYMGLALLMPVSLACAALVWARADWLLRA